MKTLYSKLLVGLVTLLVVVGIASALNHTSPQNTTLQALSPNVQSPSTPLTTEPTDTLAQVPTPQAVFNATLTLGSTGTNVANVQQFLADEGLYFARDAGIFDQSTLDAVLAFQKKENLTPNGIWGQAEQTRANTIVATHPDWLTTLSNTTTYTNTYGSPVHSPAYSTNGVPAGASAICRDGTYSFSMHRSGTCSYHGGVRQWLY